MFNPHELCSDKFVKGQTVPLVAVVELLNATSHGPLRLEFRKRSRQLATINTVTARIRTSSLCILNLRVWHDVLHHIGNIVDLIILFCSADIECFIVHEFARRMENGKKRPANILDVYKWPPRSTITTDERFTSRVSKGNKVIDHEVTTQFG